MPQQKIKWKRPKDKNISNSLEDIFMWIWIHNWLFIACVICVKLTCWLHNYQSHNTSMAMTIQWLVQFRQKFIRYPPYYVVHNGHLNAWRCQRFLYTLKHITLENTTGVNLLLRLILHTRSFLLWAWRLSFDIQICVMSMHTYKGEWYNFINKVRVTLSKLLRFISSCLKKIFFGLAHWYKYSQYKITVNEISKMKIIEDR